MRLPLQGLIPFLLAVASLTIAIDQIMSENSIDFIENSALSSIDVNDAGKTGSIDFTHSFRSFAPGGRNHLNAIRTKRGVVPKLVKITHQ